ncbi:hypothetical protein THIOM_004117 [Candidatus Thiomargarita nelsonii]|uniref:Uncharacterized protein n=1 Tax=Candidatus Thiomargarita nelsonii TaxID=1003181 RepID=A0A0A6NYZ3_9GAMM|nr:hypothetical protein THIOM_004117 [Candidatus Thiomargarita nelsonii]
MNVEKKFIAEKTHSLRLPPRRAEKKPLEVDFYSVDPTMPVATLERMAIYLENPNYRIVYNPENNRDIKIPLQPGESPFTLIDDERSLCYNGTDFYLESYRHEQSRKSDQQAFYRLLAQTDIATYEIQVPEVMSVFNYGGRYYIVLRNRRKALGKTNTFMYKGMIVKHQVYEKGIWLHK